MLSRLAVGTAAVVAGVSWFGWAAFARGAVGVVKSVVMGDAGSGGTAIVVLGVVVAMTASLRQGLTLAHFSAQHKPFWSVSRFVTSLRRDMTQISTKGTQRNPQKLLMLSCEVDGC